MSLGGYHDKIMVLVKRWIEGMAGLADALGAEIEQNKEVSNVSVHGIQKEAILGAMRENISKNERVWTLGYSSADTPHCPAIAQLHAHTTWIEGPDGVSKNHLNIFDAH